jgi:hypothetical protein
VIERSEDRGTVARAVAVGVARLARLTPGAGVEAATHFAGGKTLGVVITEDRIEVHVAVRELPVAQAAERVREAARQALGALRAERPVDVLVEDVDIDRLPRSVHPQAEPAPRRAGRKA